MAIGERQLHQLYAPINVKPQGRGRGWGDPGDFDIFMEARVKFLTPGHLGNVKFPLLGDFVLLATCLSSQIPDPRAAFNCQNPDPGESWPSQFPVGSPLPPTLGLNIDRCIIFNVQITKSLLKSPITQTLP